MNIRPFLPLASSILCPKVATMLNRCFLALLCFMGAPGVFAQVRVELFFEQETYLPQEALYAIVRVYNSSGQTLKLGDTPDWLSFTVEAVDGRLVRQKKAADVIGEFTLPSGSRAKKVVNLAEAFELSRFGRYKASATVRIPQWNQTFDTASSRQFGISPGVKLWESVFGVPSDKPGTVPESRKFLLLQANRANRSSDITNPREPVPRELTLFARITDASEAETFALVPLGPLVGFSQPEPQVDRWSNLHVIYHDGAHTFLYQVITPDGLLLTRQTWQLGENSRPAMVMNSEGRIEVKGGSRKISNNDLPPPELLTEKSNPPPDLLDGGNVDQAAHAEKPKKKK